MELLHANFATSPDEADFSEPTAAPLHKRVLAGMADAGILLMAGCLFAGLFALVKGNLDSTPLDLIVAGFIAVFWIFVYFGLFTAVALRTPGQAAFGLSVSNLDGERPTRQEAFLRAFGYLVSLAALMLGFLWAAMDSDGMSWHDHISGTILVENT
ncbi:MAG: RDD family protein [Terriglobia bacterium]